MEPTLVQLCREAPCVAPDTPAADAARRFADDAELSSIVVTTDPPALLSRRRVTALADGGILGETAGVLDLVEHPPLLLPPKVELHVAAREAMARPIDLRFDDAVVLTEDAPRVLPVSELLLALAQTYSAAATFGSSYSGGLFQFGGGDNRSDVFDDILERGTQL